MEGDATTAAGCCCCCCEGWELSTLNKCTLIKSTTHTVEEHAIIAIVEQLNHRKVSASKQLNRSASVLSGNSNITAPSVVNIIFESCSYSNRRRTTPPLPPDRPKPTTTMPTPPLTCPLAMPPPGRPPQPSPRSKKSKSTTDDSIKRYTEEVAYLAQAKSIVDNPPTLSVVQSVIQLICRALLMD